ncbi:hypothetical protein ACFQZV_05760 [Microbacterium koreense]|uniref:Uncharacterized protein n=1 Tax=Microbacterium koreense TaxID=323761 RepID=A0ABW2ZQB2_9MICO
MGMGPVVRSLKDALDGTPVHLRQLAEMFRKHGRKQDRNTSAVQNLDSPDFTHPLQQAWRSDTDVTPNAIVDAGKSNRPDPDAYLNADYVQAHLDQFSDGATRIYRTDSILNYGPGNNQVPGNVTNTAYVFPTDQLDALMHQANSPAELAEALGLPQGFFEGQNVQLRDFSPDELTGLRMPSGNEGGTDVDRWIPGGYLPSGIPEAVIDIPADATGWKNGDNVLDQSRWTGSWRELKL